MFPNNLPEKRRAYIKALESGLEKSVASLSRKPEVIKVILFGSYASGRRDLFTDLDLIVVIESDQDFPTRCAELHRGLSSGVDMDLLAYTPKEFEQLKDTPFLRSALQNHQVLYERR